MFYNLGWKITCLSQNCLLHVEHPILSHLTKVFIFVPYFLCLFQVCKVDMNNIEVILTILTCFKVLSNFTSDIFAGFLNINLSVCSVTWGLHRTVEFIQNLKQTHVASFYKLEDFRRHLQWILFRGIRLAKCNWKYNYS